MTLQPQNHHDGCHSDPDPMPRATAHGLGTGTTTNSENGNTALDNTEQQRKHKMMGRPDNEMTGRPDDETTGRPDDETTGNRGEEAHRTEKGPGDVADVSWATGKFFFSFLASSYFY